LGGSQELLPDTRYGIVEGDVRAQRAYPRSKPCNLFILRYLLLPVTYRKNKVFIYRIHSWNGTCCLQELKLTHDGLLAGGASAQAPRTNGVSTSEYPNPSHIKVQVLLLPHRRFLVSLTS